MNDIAIKVENLSKQYRIAGLQRAPYRTLRESLVETVQAPFRRAANLLRGQAYGAAEMDRTFLALKNVSFEVKRGEVVGIIGANGAGKSTLLKILSRITEPTEGYAEIHGRVGSLLEVGTGFHPELTGRENIYLNGAVLGMKRWEIERKFDEIVAFSGVEKFIETPVKRYSDGMRVRLAFSVAAHLEPEILLVDEVLAVGDAAFQRKCLGKMGNVAQEGRTVLFVSHDLQAITTLTKRALLFDAGVLVADGKTPLTVRHYRGSLRNNCLSGEYIAPNKTAGLVKASVKTSEPNQIHRFGHSLVFEFEVCLRRELANGAFAFQIINEKGDSIVSPVLLDSERRWSHSGKVQLRCVIPNPRIYMGRYTLTTHLGDIALKQYFETVECICPFEVVMDGVRTDDDWNPFACVYLEDTAWIVVGIDSIE